LTTLTLQLRLKQDEGALVRLLGVTRRRRFHVLSLKVFPSTEAGFFDVQMTVRADRSGNSLVRQIEKLVETSDVEVIELTDPVAEARAAHSGL
jgi:acetolactate synthase regulatory subunit